MIFYKIDQDVNPFKQNVERLDSLSIKFQIFNA